MSLGVRPVESRRDLREFIELPFRLHATHEQWVPPLRIERRLFLSRRFNAFFKDAEAQLFLARRDGRVVGRISAQIDHAFNSLPRQRLGRCSASSRCEEDHEVFGALLDAAADWLRERGRDHMVGPMDFTMNDECGVLIEGFDREPVHQAALAPALLPGLCEEAGLAEGGGPAGCGSSTSRTARRSCPPSSRWRRSSSPSTASASARCRGGACGRELDLFGETYNEAWKDNWGFVPYSEEDLDHYAQELQLVFDRNWFMVAEKVDTGESVGVAITVPDINQVLKKMNGRLLPFGWWHFLRRAQDHGPRARRLPRRQARVPAHRRGGRASTSSTSTWRPRPRRSGARWAGSSRPTTP